MLEVLDWSGNIEELQRVNDPERGIRFVDTLSVYVDRPGKTPEEEHREAMAKYRGQRAIRWQNEQLAGGGAFDDVHQVTDMADDARPERTEFCRRMGELFRKDGVEFDQQVFDHEDKITWGEWNERMPGYIEGWGNDPNPENFDKFVAGRTLEKQSTAVRERYVQANAIAFMTGNGRGMRVRSYTGHRDIVAYPPFNSAPTVRAFTDRLAAIVEELRDRAFEDLTIWTHMPLLGIPDELLLGWREFNRVLMREAIECGHDLKWFNPHTYQDRWFVKDFRQAARTYTRGDFFRRLEAAK
jgi:hypothetical protein